MIRSCSFLFSVPSHAPDTVHAEDSLACSVDQVPTLYVVRLSSSALVCIHPTNPGPKIVVYAVVIFALWNIPGARLLITPLKLFTIGWHELCHIVVVRTLTYVSPLVFFADHRPDDALNRRS